jgi:peroxiredoxin
MPLRSSIIARVLAVSSLLLPTAALVAGCGGQGAASAEGAHPLVGAKAPELSAQSVTGEGPSKLADASGRVVIVDFWATYCAPCKKSFPKYQELVDQFGGDLAVIAVSVDDPEDVTPEQIKDFADQTGVKFAVVWDKDRSVAPKYTPPKMPTSFVIDKDGTIRHIHAGYESGEEKIIAAEVEALIKK